MRCIKITFRNVFLTLFYVAMHWGARSLDGNVGTQPQNVFHFHVAVRRGVRPLHGDVVSIVCRHATARSLLAWRYSKLHYIFIQRGGRSLNDGMLKQLKNVIFEFIVF